MEEIKIGNQIWMKSNLDVEIFQNGERIQEAKSDEEWKMAYDKGQPAWCYYLNYEKEYGKLYNLHAVSDPRGLAPVGYHIPSDDEWNISSSKAKSNFCGQLFDQSLLTLLTVVDLYVSIVTNLEMLANTEVKFWVVHRTYIVHLQEATERVGSMIGSLTLSSLTRSQVIRKPNQDKFVAETFFDPLTNELGVNFV